MRASRSPDHAVGPLLGRARERAAVESVLARARKSESAVLLVRGERETGKTELVEHAVRSAGGMRVLRARGFEAEAELRFSALAELLRPLLGL
ncbi:MAG: AAA family ATPase, partial [Thermoleophilia bacterium]|nr:AAA family ATPase [Thermoleophilia bacterium]